MSTEVTPTVSVPATIAEEDRARADLYRLLASFLTAPPPSALLQAAAALTGDETQLGKAIAMLAKQARATTEVAARDEYHALFIGLTRGELLPYASYYLTGFLHEKPLARLRTDMAQLDIAADRKFAEPEDHVAAVLESMAGLIDGTFGQLAPLDAQRRFFEAHVANWVPLFFRDLSKAEAARLYCGVAAIGDALMTIEREAFQRD